MKASESNLWEESKENIQPIKSGRKMQSIQQALNKDDNDVMKKKIREFEHAIRMSENEKKIDVWYEYIHWMQQSSLYALRKVVKLMRQCITSLHDMNIESFNKNEKFVEIWISMAEQMDDPQTIFEYMLDHEIGTSLSIFYKAISEYYEFICADKKADEFYQLGIRRSAQPLQSLQTAYKSFCMRMVSRKEGNSVSFESTESSRKILGHLRSTKSGKVGNNRSQLLKDGGAKSSASGYSMKSKTDQPQQNFQIYGDSNDDNGNNAKIQTGKRSIKTLPTKNRDHENMKAKETVLGTKVLGGGRSVCSAANQKFEIFKEENCIVEDEKKLSQNIVLNTKKPLGKHVDEQRSSMSAFDLLKAKESSNVVWKCCINVIYMGASEVSFEELKAELPKYKVHKQVTPTTEGLNIRTFTKKEACHDEDFALTEIQPISSEEDLFSCNILDPGRPFFESTAVIKPCHTSKSKTVTNIIDNNQKNVPIDDKIISQRNSNKEKQHIWDELLSNTVCQENPVETIDTPEPVKPPMKHSDIDKTLFLTNNELLCQLESEFKPNVESNPENDVVNELTQENKSTDGSLIRFGGLCLVNSSLKKENLTAKDDIDETHGNKIKIAMKTNNQEPLFQDIATESNNKVVHQELDVQAKENITIYAESKVNKFENVKPVVEKKASVGTSAFHIFEDNIEKFSAKSQNFEDKSKNEVNEQRQLFENDNILNTFKSKEGLSKPCRTSAFTNVHNDEQDIVSSKHSLASQDAIEEILTNTHSSISQKNSVNHQNVVSKEKGDELSLFADLASDFLLTNKKQENNLFVATPSFRAPKSINRTVDEDLENLFKKDEGIFCSKKLSQKPVSLQFHSNSTAFSRKPEAKFDIFSETTSATLDEQQHLENELCNYEDLFQHSAFIKTPVCHKKLSSRSENNVTTHSILPSPTVSTRDAKAAINMMFQDDEGFPVFNSNELNEETTPLKSQFSTDMGNSAKRQPFQVFADNHDRGKRLPNEHEEFISQNNCFSITDSDAKAQIKRPSSSFTSNNKSAFHVYSDDGTNSPFRKKQNIQIYRDSNESSMKSLDMFSTTCEANRTESAMKGQSLFVDDHPQIFSSTVREAHTMSQSHPKQPELSKICNDQQNLSEYPSQFSLSTIEEKSSEGSNAESTTPSMDNRNESTAALYDTINPFTTNLIERHLENVMSELVSNPNFIQLSGPSPKLQGARMDINLGPRNYRIVRLLLKNDLISVYRANNQENKPVSLKFGIETSSCSKIPILWNFYISNEIQRRLQLQTYQQQYGGHRFVRTIYTFKYSNAVCTETPFYREGSLENVVQLYRKFNTTCDEILVMLYSYEILSIIQQLHSINIIHCNIRPSQFLQANSELSSQDVFSVRCLALKGYENSIDLNQMESYKSHHDTMFVGSWPNKDGADAFECAEMRGGKPWKYQIDHFAAASTIHLLVFQNSMNTFVDTQTGKLKIAEIPPSDWQVELWVDVFTSLINSRGDPGVISRLLARLESFLTLSDSVEMLQKAFSRKGDLLMADD